MNDMTEEKMKEKWAHKERGLRLYSEGKDVYGEKFYVQDGSWAMFAGVRIYGHNSSNEKEEICLSLKVKDAKKLIIGLKKFVDKREESK